MISLLFSSLLWWSGQLKCLLSCSLSLAIPAPMATTGRTNTTANRSWKTQTQHYSIFSVDIQMIWLLLPKPRTTTPLQRKGSEVGVIREEALWMKMDNMTDWYINCSGEVGWTTTQNSLCATHTAQPAGSARQVSTSQKHKVQCVAAIKSWQRS